MNSGYGIRINLRQGKLAKGTLRRNISHLLCRKQYRDEWMVHSESLPLRLISDCSHLGIEIIVAILLGSNAPSMNLLLKSGFVELGRPLGTLKPMPIDTINIIGKKGIGGA